MNPFQRARAKALEIREQLQPGRANQPLKASELLSRIEDELKLGVESVPADYHDLGSGSAVLDRFAKFIYVSTKYAAGTDTHAGLVAHEVGHWFLDPELSAKTVADYQAVFGSAGSPATLQVEAYGARERQELQANVFAREFLLPRAVAKALFEAGKGLRQVAHELGIPLDFAQQQMLDAVLLPEAVEKPAVLHVPSPAQWRAARAPERFANVVAGPGTGKTSTLIHRVKYLVEELKVDPRHILVLTFTNKAAFELVERLRAAGIERASDIWAGTFHAFGLEFLRKYHQRFGLKPSFAVADNLQVMQTLVGGLPRLQLNHYLRVVDPYLWLGKVVKVISRAKEEMLTAADYRQAIQTFRSDDPEIQARREDIATLFEAHTGLLRQRNSVDFVDLITEPARAISNDRAQYSELADRFQHILVDEYQDVTKAMVVLLRRLAHHEAKIWVVGDIRQAIHHWRGASLYSLLRFDEEFQSGAGGGRIGKYPLDINRRSSDEVLALVQQAGRLHALERRLPLDDVSSAVGKLGIRPVLTHCKEKKQVPGAVVDAIEALAAEGVRLGDQVVLCRKGRDVEDMFAQLKARDVDVIHMGELSRAPEVKLLLCLMQLLVERQPRALIGLTAIPALTMPMADIQLLMAASEQAVELQRGRWLHAPPHGLSAKALEVIGELKVLLGRSTHNSNPWPFVCDLMLEHGLALPAISDTSVDAAVTRLRLWQFAYAVRNGEGDIRESKLSRFLLRFRLRERVGESYGQRELPPEAAQLNGVRLLTIHGAKGLEFDAVHVFQTDADRFGPQVRQEEWDDNNILDLLSPEMLGSAAQAYLHEQTVERNNLLYVALSRAKRHLRMYVDTQFKNSSFAPQLEDPEHYQYVYVDTKAGRGRAAPPAPIVTGPKSVDFSEFCTFYECPLQHWYQNVMQLPREQQYESGIRAQGAIMRVLKAVAAGATEEPADLLATEWAASKLASATEDPGLWGDAEYALERGLAKVADLRAKGGTFCEATSVVGGLRILLPWGFRIEDAYRGSEFHVVLFSRRTYEMTTMFKPIITGLEVAGQCHLVFHSVLSDLVDDGEPARWVEKTNGFAAAVGLLAGSNAPAEGRHCGRCSYATICPSAPALP